MAISVPIELGGVITSLVGLAGVLFGGVGLKVVEAWLNRSKDKDNSQLEMRKELRSEIATKLAEIDNLRKQLQEIEDELDQWREKYYTLREEFLELKFSRTHNTPAGPSA